MSKSPSSRRWLLKQEAGAIAQEACGERFTTDHFVHNKRNPIGRAIKLPRWSKLERYQSQGNRNNLKASMANWSTELMVGRVPFVPARGKVGITSKPLA